MSFKIVRLAMVQTTSMIVMGVTRMMIPSMTNYVVAKE
jgi:hypothetical protein